MTLGAWLSARHPRAPEALQRRLAEALGDAAACDVSEAPALLLDAGERLIATLLAANSSSRDSALDLLTADALVTYAFEAASESPAVLRDRANDAMRRIAALGATNNRHSALTR